MGMRVPGWVWDLVEESFFVGCEAHESRMKNEKNIFCLACCTSICPHYASAHRHHPLLRFQPDYSYHHCFSSFTPPASLSVWRYVYNDVVCLGDLEKRIDCSYVQPYTINIAKVNFLKPRPQSRPFKGSVNVCLTCDRILQEPFHFCCLSCKVDHMVEQGGGRSNILLYRAGDELLFPRFENLHVGDADSGQVTPNSMLENPLHHCNGYIGGSGGSSDNADDGNGNVGQPAVVKRKKGGGFFPKMVLSLGNRRKVAPHRSPLA